MGDTNDAGKTVGEHWPLLLIALGAAWGLVMALRILRAMLREEMSEVVKLSLTTNGTAKLLRDQIQLAVSESVEKAMTTHVFICPVKAEIGGVHERVRAQHDRLLALERIVVQGGKEGIDG